MFEPVPDPKAAAAADPATAADPAAFMDQLEGLLDKLVPEDGVVMLVTCDGTELALPTALPARRQVRAFRLLRALLEREEVQAGLGVFQGGTTATVVDAVVGLATDEGVAEALGAVFSAAYPDLLPEGTDPLDVLPLEELVRSILPFSARFARQLGAGLASLLQLSQ